MFVASCLFSTVLATVFGGAGATAQTPDPASSEVKCPEPSPSPTPIETPSPTESLDPDLPIEEEPAGECDEDGDGDGGNNNGGDKGDDDDDNKPDRPDEPKENDDGDNGDGKKNDGPSKKGSNNQRNNKGRKSKGDGAKKTDADVDLSTSPSKHSGNYELASGEFDTDRLQLIAAQLRARGVSEEAILERVFSPFIIAGPAAWTDTWGAPRYGPGPLVRTHEGQDVFCKYGDPVLATQSGEIEFDEGGLGGTVARLYRKDGSYFYYAHLSGWNTKEFEDGDRVEAGDVIGFCGNSGNAITTPPHVHFGWYRATGGARNPMGMLVKWLHMAERNAGAAYEKATGRSLATIEQSGSSRLFGDGFAPDISELEVSSEALLAASSSPGAGGFGLADVAIQAAMTAQQSENRFDGEVEVDSEGAGDEHSELADLLDSPGEAATPGAATGD